MATNGDTRYTVPLLINGKNVTAKTNFPVSAPAISKDIWNCSSASKEDGLAAVEAAQNAFDGWRRTHPTKRRDILLKAADLFAERGKDIAELMKQETGSLDAFATFNVQVTGEMIKDTAGRILAHSSGIIPTCEQPGMNALVYKEPYGVIFTMAPWNAPLILGTRAFIGALGTGNTIVFKGSELSPRTFHALMTVFIDAGLPPGVLNAIYCSPSAAPEVTNAIIEHPAVKKLTFTGSTAVGKIIAGAAGKNLKPVIMELGGKASAIVCEDADLEHAAMQCALGAFLHSGQICMSTERIVVNEKIIEPFTKLLKASVDKMWEGAGDTPVLIQSKSVEKNHALINDAVKGGAKMLHGDLDARVSSATRMQPIIVGDVKPQHRLYHEESFGPSVSLIAVPSDEKAIEIANDTAYGLSGAVFSKDLGKALSIAKRVESGAVHINHMSIHDESNVPHGGTKQSGWGRFNAGHGLEEFLKTKTITFSGVDMS